MLDDELTLKFDELFLVGQSFTDATHESGAGLYLRDTRHLSQLRITINGQPLDRLALQPTSSSSAIIISANAGESRHGEEGFPARTVGVEQHIELISDLHNRIAVQSYNEGVRKATIALEAAADFRDLFDIRGFAAWERGASLPVDVNDYEFTLGYKGVDGLVAKTQLCFDRVPNIEVGTSMRGYPVVRASFEADFVDESPWFLAMRISPQPVESTQPVVWARPPSREPRPKPWIETDNVAFNHVIHQSISDLDMLQTTFPEGSVPAAGIPWYVAPFGRDALITCLQTIHLYPERAIETLRLLAAYQGTKVDDRREEQPGKILHERRYGELARTNAIPHSPYYGTIDATPLFVMLFVELVKWTGDGDIYRWFIPHVRRAIEWIEKYGDRDGDGFIEYCSFSHGLGDLTHQGWKDSWDSLHHRDGRPATGNIALVEVQGYIYSALVGVADLLETYDDSSWAEHLRLRAESLRARVEDAFWQDEIDFYAQGLDGDKSPVCAVSSNPGHLLYCGLPTEDRADRIAQRLSRADMDSGWGIRTLSSDAVTYNPMSYHNGSVWPHDNSLIAAGFYRYGFIDAGHHIASDLFSAAESQLHSRLPELYCGFSRGKSLDAPVSYPVTCSPQAWAAGSMPLLLRCFLGLEPAGESGNLRIDPAFPSWLNEVTICHLPYRQQEVNLTVRRSGTGYDCEADYSISRKCTAAMTEE